MANQEKATDAQQEPVYWFVVLEKALERSDFDEAAHAQRELNRLGVCVSYRRRRDRKESPHAS